MPELYTAWNVKPGRSRSRVTDALLKGTAMSYETHRRDSDVNANSIEELINELGLKSGDVIQWYESVNEQLVVVVSDGGYRDITRDPLEHAKRWGR